MTLFFFTKHINTPLCFFLVSERKQEQMERQRSISLKPTRFLIFSFTISSTLIFLLIFSILVFHNTPSIPKEFESLQLNTSSSNNVTIIKPMEAQGLTGLSRNFTVWEVKNSVLNDTHYRKPHNSTRNIVGVVGKGGQRNASEAQNGVLRSTHVKKSYTSSEKIEEVPSSKRSEEKSSSSSSSSSSSVCDVSNGRWVYDESYPLYTNKSCPFIDEGFSCETNGRKDTGYMKWRWQPHGCDIPRFDAVKMLELIRGKRLVFVGDSINRNQWESMLCLLRGAVKDPSRIYEAHGRRITKEKGNYSFKFLDYRCTVEYYATHFLVHESKGRIGKKRVPTLRIDAMDRGSSRWKGADILVFNTAHWWSHFKTKAGINYYQEGNEIHPKLDVSTAFRKALMTWASWVDAHITPRRTKVFFRSSSPSHFKGGLWNSGGHCKEGIQPLNDTSNTHDSEKNTIAEEVIKQMKTPVTILNVTSLSEYRIDGHPSIYGRKPGKGSSGQDCSHWCLPGVPDTWNEQLFFYLQSKQKIQFH